MSTFYLKKQQPWANVIQSILCKCSLIRGTECGNKLSLSHMDPYSGVDPYGYCGFLGCPGSSRGKEEEELQGSAGPAVPLRLVRPP